jgi:parvulin-like peptidyl-prolyl isomerase
VLQLFTRPWLHFLLIGSGLFFAQQWLFPPPKPTVGPLTEARVESLRRQWFATTGRLPSELQLARMEEAELDREILYREALSLELQKFDPIVQQRLVRNMRFLKLDDGRDEEELLVDAMRMELYLGDEVVKRRLVQLMEQILLARNPPLRPTADDLLAEFEQRREELKRPPRYSLQQVFLTRERAAEAEALLARFREQGISPDQALESSSPFLPGYRFDGRSPEQLARQFGAAFVLNLQNLSPRAGTWVGPVESTYGVHLVWVEQIVPAREATLAEVEDQLRRDLELMRRQEALAAAVAQVRKDYEVML